MKSKIIKTSSLISFLFAFAISALAFNVSADDKDNGQEEIVTVSVQALSDLNLDINVSVPATVRALNQSLISSQINALAKKVHVDVGDKVQANQLLLSLDCREYEFTKKQIEASIKAANISFDLASKNYQRNKRLSKQGNVSAQAFDQVEANYLNSQAELTRQKSQLSLADLNIERCQIKAPFAGQISKRLVQPGQLLTPNAAVVELLQTDKLEIEASLSQEDMHSFRQAEQLDFKYDNQSYPVKLRAVIGLLDEASRTQRVRLKFVEEVKLPINLSGRLVWKKDGYYLPASLLSQRGEKLGVLYLAEENTVAFHAIAGAIEGKISQLGLPADTKIIIDNRKGLKVGQRVKVEKEKRK